ncbi:hypothetical protein M514_14696 [Trichuris suis]|uniref:Uncharacterized protein n=1 Tax=Trichuris suis TaxID=68888 RepID=A0A085NV60_9BILA|nr:hypothetical protein M514_14696 [Trichuris suis]
MTSNNRILAARPTEADKAHVDATNFLKHIPKRRAYKTNVRWSWKSKEVTAIHGATASQQTG